MKKDEKTKVAEQMRIYRAINRLSQEKLGELCGLSQRTISLIESGEFNRVSADTFNKVAEYVVNH
jgi:transcriptional regulator with XRE-family HTH domain